MASRLVCFALLCLPTFLPLQLKAQNWQQGPLGNRRDLTPSAVSTAQLGSDRVLVSNAAFAFMACRGEDNGKPVFELRFSAPSFPGDNAASVPAAGSIAIDGEAHPASVMTFVLQNRAFFATEPDPATVRRIATVGHDRSATLSFHFTASGRNFDFITTLGEPSAPVAVVLTACGIPTAPPTPDPIPTGTSRGTAKYAIDGIRLGMTQPEVAAALKLAGSTRGLEPDRAGNLKASTRDAIFPDIQFNNLGQVWSFHVLALNPRHLRGTNSSGPTYDMARQAFGPPTTTTGTIRWGVEAINSESATYEWDAEDLPWGDIWITDGRQNVNAQ